MNRTTTAKPKNSSRSVSAKSSLAVFGALKPERVKFSEIAAHVLEDHRENDRATAADVERRLRLRLLPALGDVRAADLGTSHLEWYRTKRRAAGATNANINHELAIVTRAFRTAAKCDPPLVNRIPQITMLTENNLRKGFLEHGGYMALREQTPGAPASNVRNRLPHRRARGRIDGVAGHQAHFDAKRIVLQPGETKNGEGRASPIYGEMLEWLRIEKQGRDQNFKTRPFRVQLRRGEVNKLARRLGHGLQCRGGSRVAISRSPQDGGSQHGTRGHPGESRDADAMQISGHKTRAIFDRYNIVNERDLTDAAAKMDRHLSTLGIISRIPE